MSSDLADKEGMFCDSKDVLENVVTALFAAWICLATMLVQIPIPATDGDANWGGAVILITAFLIQPVSAVIAIVAAEAFMVVGYFCYKFVLMGAALARQAV